MVEVLSPVLYRLRKEMVLHHDCLKRCKDRIIPIWLRRLRNALHEDRLPPPSGVIPTDDTPADVDASAEDADGSDSLSVDLGEGEVGEEGEPALSAVPQPTVPLPVRTRAGRLSVPPARFRE